MCFRQLDVHPSSQKGRQNTDEQTCVFNTFLPAQCLWESEQHLHPAKAAPVCANQLLLADVQRKHQAPTKDSWALHTPVGGQWRSHPTGICVCAQTSDKLWAGIRGRGWSSLVIQVSVV